MDAAMTRRIVLELPGGGGSMDAEVTDQDARTLRDLLSGAEARQVGLTAREAPDTAGHSAISADTIELDVEGHAITLRLPHPDDVGHLRRRIATGVITATIIAGGATLAVGLDVGPITEPAIQPVIRTGPEVAPPPTRQELLIRINEAGAGDTFVPVRGDEPAPPAAPRPGEAARPF